MNRIDRVTAILIQLQTKKLVTAKDIAQRFHISLRTVYRDIRTLEEAGIPIGSEAGKGYYLVDGYHLPPVMFTAGEVSSLIKAAKVMQGYGDEACLKDLASAIYKIKAILKYDDKSFAQELEDKVYCTCRQETTLTNNALDTLQTAIYNKQVLLIHYVAMGKQEPESRTVEPISLGFFDNNWYLIAFCLLRKEYRTFRVDRIKNVSVEKKEFAHKHQDSMEQIFKQMLSGKTLHKVVLRMIKGGTYHSLKKKYLLGYLEETDLGESMELSLQTDSLEVLGKQLIEYMSSSFTDIEIIEPEELKTIIHKLLDQLTERCNKLISC